jgi:hypothetical protein
VVEPNEGTIDLGGGSGDLEVWSHAFTVALFTREGYTAEAHAEAVELMEAVTDAFRSQMTLGGLVTVVHPNRYTVGRLAYQDKEYTGVALRFSAEAKDDAELS